MNQRQIIGRRVATFEKYNEVGPITGIMLLVDDDSYYQAGDRSGYMIEINCPYGSQQMANNLLTSLRGKTYKGFRATDAEIGMSAELGDAVSVNGLYTLLAHRVLTFGPGHMSDISAPGNNEVEHEYPYISSTQKEFNRQEAKTQSLITKTAEEIRLEVNDLGNDLRSSITITGNEIRQEVNDLGNDLRSSIAITEREIRQEVNDLEDDLRSSITITGNEIRQEVNNLDANLRAVITVTENEIRQEVSGLEGQVTSVSTTVNGLTVSGPYGETNINGNTIATGTVNTTQLAAQSVTSDKIYLSGLLAVYDPYGNIAGYIGYGNSLIDGSYGINMFNAFGGGMIATQYGAKIQYAQSEVSTTGGGVNVKANGATYYFIPGTFHPEPYAYPTLGTPSNLWGQIYSTDSVVSTSDERLKNSVEAIPDKYVSMLDNLTPIRYKLNNGTSGRYHTGFSAQNVKAAMDSAGISDQEFGGFVKGIGADGNDVMMLRYDEFIGIQLKKIQQMEKRIERLESALTERDGG